VANGTDSGPKALPGSFSFAGKRKAQARTGQLRHKSEGRFVVSCEAMFCWRQAAGGERRSIRGKSRSVGEGQRGDIMACTVRD
jgi:hypothetical protein